MFAAASKDDPILRKHILCQILLIVHVHCIRCCQDTAQTMSQREFKLAVFCFKQIPKMLHCGLLSINVPSFGNYLFLMIYYPLFLLALILNARWCET